MTAVMAAVLRHRSGATRRLPFDEFAVFLSSAAFALVADWRILTSPLYHHDAAINLAWIRRLQDRSLFQDPMTSELDSTGFPPPGPRLLYSLAAQLGDPIVGAEWLGVLLAATAGWLVFRVTRTQTDWGPGPWLATGLFLAAWPLLRISGGYSHSFFHVIVLATVALLVSRRLLSAVLIPPLGVLFYAPACLVSLGILAIACIRSLRPFALDRRLALLTFGSAVVCFALSQAFLAEGDPFTRAQAQRYPEFGADGKMHFFLPSTLEMLRQNYSGFDLRAQGSILLVAAVVLLLLGRVRLRREIWAMPISGLACFVAAYVVLFRLYLPSRYAYPLFPFAAIATGAALLPAWRRAAAENRLPGQALLGAALSAIVFVVAISVLPLGPVRDFSDLAALAFDVLPWIAGALAVALLIAILSRVRHRRWPRALAAGFVGAILIGEVAGISKVGKATGVDCGWAAASGLAALPPDTVVAGNPVELNCVLLGARRPVVVSTKQFQPVLGRSFFLRTRKRMALAVRAYYGDSFSPVVALAQRYDADVLLVTPESVQDPGKWLTRHPFRENAPFSDFVRRASARRGPTASLRLPRTCLLWATSERRLYDLPCVETWVSMSGGRHLAERFRREGRGRPTSSRTTRTTTGTSSSAAPGG